MDASYKSQDELQKENDVALAKAEKLEEDNKKFRDVAASLEERWRRFESEEAMRIQNEVDKALVKLWESDDFQNTVFLESMGMLKRGFYVYRN